MVASSSTVRASLHLQFELENANILLDAFKNNNESFVDFLSTQFTVRDLRGALEGVGIKTGKGGLNYHNRKTYGLWVFMFGQDWSGLLSEFDG